jgi:hypothetical protein
MLEWVEAAFHLTHAISLVYYGELKFGLRVSQLCAHFQELNYRADWEIAVRRSRHPAQSQKAEGFDTYKGSPWWSH